jgi:hypothetical protein
MCKSALHLCYGSHDGMLAVEGDLCSYSNVSTGASNVGLSCTALTCMPVLYCWHGCNERGIAYMAETCMKLRHLERIRRG